LRGYGAIVALAAFVVFSFWLARRAAMGRGLRLDRAASALALVAIVPALWHLDSPPRDYINRYSYSVHIPPGLYLDGQQINNVFPYSRDGTPLNDVLLYLPDGRPLDIGAGINDLNRRYLVNQRGQRLYNSFPVRYFDPGTSKVTHPNAGPRVHIPVVLTPPLGTHVP